MSLFKRKPNSPAEGGEPAFVEKKIHSNGCVYETYRAADAEVAKDFLMATRVERELYYVVVETPDGNWGTDVEGLYLENLRPWQLDVGAAEHVGDIRSVTNYFGLATAASGHVDNFVVQIRCGQCGEFWHDGVRYQDYTLVRCPHCRARNSVDSSGIVVTEQPDGQVTVTMGAHITGDDSWQHSREAAPGEVARQVALDQAVTLARTHLDATPPGHPHRAGRLHDLAQMLEEQFNQSDDLADLDAAIATFAAAAEATSPDDSVLPHRSAAVGRVLTRRYEYTGALTDLDAAIAARRDTLAIAPLSAPDLHALQSTLGQLLRDRFERTTQSDDLADAVDAAVEAVRGVSPEDYEYPIYLANLSAVLRVRFEHVGDLDDLDWAITAAQSAAEAAEGTDHPVSVTGGPILGLALLERYLAVGDLADLHKTIATLRDAMPRTPPNDPNYPPLHHNFGRALLARFKRFGDLADIEAAVAAIRTAAAAVAGTSDPNRVTYLALLGEALVSKFEQTADLGDLSDGIAAHRQAAAATPAGHRDHALHLTGLGTALLARFRRAGEPDDLTGAVEAVRAAVRAIPPRHPERSVHLNALCRALGARFEHIGDLADVDEAIAAGRESVAGTSPGDAAYPGHVSTLGSALHARYLYTGHLSDLDDAIATARAAMAAAPPDHLHHHVIAYNVTTVLLERFRRTRDPADLDDAITARRKAVAGTPLDHPLHAMHLHALSYALRARYGDAAQADDLEEAMTTARAAIAVTPGDEPARPGRLMNLAVVLLLRFEHTRTTGDLDEAVGLAREAIAGIPQGHPDRAEALSVLGIVLRTRFEHAGDQRDFDDAIAASKESVHVESGPPENRITSAVAWGRAAIAAGDVDSAAEGFEAAIRLLPRFVWHGLPRATREERVAKWSGLAADAAACAIRAGRPEQAVELLEAGRSVLWGQLLNLRTDLTDLHEREPALAARLDQVRALLDTPLPTRSEDVAADPAEMVRADPNRVAEERMRLAREFDELVGQVRAVEGFEHFLEPTSFDQLRAAAQDGPVAMVNTSRHGCHALLVMNDGVQVVDLPGLTHPKVVAQANTMVGILARANGSGRSFLDRERDRHTVLEILDWLWDKIAEPVLAELGYTGPPARGEAWPRMWWCPTGRLAMLPLHAAGHHPRHAPTGQADVDTVPDRVISSYTSTLSALLRARKAPASTARPSLLAVGMPSTPGAGDLPAVPAELDKINTRYPIATRLQALTSAANEPTVARVQAELSEHAWVHLACHASQDFSDPMASAFWLTDGPLRIADLIQKDSGSRELAFLSACQTSVGDLRAADEAIHLAACMQLLGYHNVIATMWSIYDSLAPHIADGVYAILTDTPDVAYALHRAVAAVRAQHLTNPLVWAPYIHTGP